MRQKPAIFFLTALTVIGFSWGFFELSQANKAAALVETDASRAFYELMNAADELTVLTAKAAVAADGDNRADLYAEISRKAYVAQENLSMLPVYNNTLSKTEQFLNQIGDYSASLVPKAARSERADAEEAKAIRSLNKNVTDIASSLHDLEERDHNAFSYKAIKAASKSIRKSDYANAGSAAAGLSDISDAVAKSPSLIYDGPYSDHLENKGQIRLDGEKINWKTALKTAEKLFGKSYHYSAYGKSSEAAGIAVCTVALRKSENDEPFAYLDLTVNGGHPAQYTAASEDGPAVFSEKQALAAAEDFLKKAGYEGLKAGYHITSGSKITMNFTSMIGETIVYPDMIKVSVDLNSGAVTGLDAKNYLEFHKERVLPSLTLTEEAAAEHLPDGVTPVAVHTAVIPKADQSEVFCYEFRFRENDTDYLIYINAETGKEEDVLVIIDGKNGTFTM